MKKLLLCLILPFAFAQAFAQSKTFEKFKSQFGEDERNTSITLEGNLFHLVGAIAGLAEDDPEAQAFARIANGLESLELISVGKYQNDIVKSDIAQMKKGFAKEKYEEMMKVKEDGQTIHVLAGSDKNRLEGMMVMIDGPKELTVMNIKGVLDFKDLAFLAKKHKTLH